MLYLERKKQSLDPMNLALLEYSESNEDTYLDSKYYDRASKYTKLDQKKISFSVICSPCHGLKVYIKS